MTLIHRRQAALLLTAAASLLSCKNQSTAGVQDAVGGGAAGKLSINDVSILFPLNAAGAAPHKMLQLIKAADVGSKGAMLPQVALNAASSSQANGFITAGRVMKTFTPVSMRIDPCAPIPSDDDSKCLKQLRLVWQADKSDAAVHTVYDLTASEFSALAHELVRLKAASGLNYDREPLGVQPVMRKEGGSGPFTTGVVNLIKKYAGADNLVFISFFTTDNTSTQTIGPWNFAAASISGGKATVAPMVHSGAERLSVRGFSVAFGKSSTGLTQVQKQLDTIVMPTLTPGAEEASASSSRNDNDATLLKVSEEDQRKAYDFLLRIENPTMASVPTNVCTDCHVASMQRDLIEQAHPDWRSEPNANRFAAPASQHMLPLFSSSLHNFGYFGEDRNNSDGVGVSISQRTLNESQVVLDWVNQKILK